jgi:type I restriction-modification system DNA methylase subunit
MKEKMRKKHGQYYTDANIVRFMLSKLEIINENKSILDPACGYGIFLLEYYTIAKNSMLKNGYNEDHVYEKLLDKIWGLDIDQYAIQVASKNILSQNQKGSQHKTNIFYKNSLESKIVLSKKFDYIVGNPPFYIVDAKKQPYSSIIKSGFYDKILNNNLNIASLFLFGYSKQLKEHGQLAFVFPRSFIHVNSFKTLRKEILNLKIQYIYDIGRAFKDVGLEQLLLILKNEDPSDNQIHYGLLDFDKSNSKICEKLSYDISQDYFYSTENNVFEVFSGFKPGKALAGKDIKEKMITLSNGETVLDYCEDIKRGLGIQKKSSKTRQKNSDLIIIGGRSIFNFGKKGPETYNYVDREEVIKEKIPIKVKLNLLRPKIMLQNLVSSKIRIVGFIDENPLSDDFILDGNEIPIYTLTYDTITNLYLKDQRYARFLLGILLSELITYFLRDIILVRATLTLHLDKKYLNKIPIVKPTTSQLTEIERITIELEEFVKERQELYPVKARERPKWENPNHQDYNDYKELVDELNEKIYDLYNLTSEEIEFIKSQLLEFGNYY